MNRMLMHVSSSTREEHNFDIRRKPNQERRGEFDL